MPTTLHKAAWINLTILFCVVLWGDDATAQISAASQSADQVFRETAAKAAPREEKIALEKISGDVWISPNVKQLATSTRRVTVKVWFETQLLGAGDSYDKRAKEFSSALRRKLRARAILTLQSAAQDSFTQAKPVLQQLEAEGVISGIKRHWIVNGFTCTTTVDKIDKLKTIPGAKKIFVAASRGRRGRASPQSNATEIKPPAELPKFNPREFKHPWYVRSLLADRVWSQFKVTGKGTLNVIHDFNFVFPEHLTGNLYRNPKEIPGNQKDDDGNGLVDDVHGYNFQMQSARLTIREGSTPQTLHGTTCASIVCGRGTSKNPFELGIAPQAKWAGVIAGADLESAVEWAVLQGADTYSMSFSIPNLGELRSHWRKVMEHGSFCGVYFVSGAGNFAQTAKVPVQMRTPENIPNVVFAAAGVQRDLSRTPFSSKGPVVWDTEHYRDGQVQKPEVCAFNFGLPMMLPDGSLRPTSANGNSFAGPMFCASIALMLDADPDLLPWDLKEIITSTATDVGPPGLDPETGHGLINCYRAVKEVLRRKAIREGADPEPFSEREPHDELDIEGLQKSLVARTVVALRIARNGNAFQAGIRAGDVLTHLSKKEIKSAKQLQELLSQQKGKMVEVTVQRGKESLKFNLKNEKLGLLRLQERFQAPVFQ